MRDQILRFLEPIKRRIFLMISKGVVRAVNDTGGIQFMQLDLLADETRDNMQRFQNYGFYGNPPLDSEAVVIFPSGNRSAGLVVCVDNRAYRIKLESGEVAIGTKFGDYVYLDKNSNFKVKAKKIKIEGQNDELLSLISDFLTEEINLADKLSTDTTNTIFGPMQLNGFAYYAARKTALQAILTKLTALKV